MVLPHNVSAVFQHRDKLTFVGVPHQMLGNVGRCKISPAVKEGQVADGLFAVDGRMFFHIVFNQFEVLIQSFNNRPSRFL